VPDKEWIPRPYGWKKILEEGERRTETLIRINPKCHTSIDIPENQLLRLPGYHIPLRAHPSTQMEHVKHLGYVDQVEDGTFNLQWVYASWAPVSEDSAVQSPIPRMLLFKKGGMFYSVLSDFGRTGYYHILRNSSHKPIELKIESLSI